MPAQPVSRRFKSLRTRDWLKPHANAAINCFPDSTSAQLDALFFASTTPPYREKQTAATVADVLDTGSKLRTADFTDTLRG